MAFDVTATARPQDAQAADRPAPPAGDRQARQRAEDAGQRPSPVDSAEISPRARELAEQEGARQRSAPADDQAAEERRAAERQADRQLADRQRAEDRLDVVA